jgi:hypothetical protein
MPCFIDPIGSNATKPIDIADKINSEQNLSPAQAGLSDLA